MSPDKPSSPETAPLPRRELIVVVTLILVGCLLRCLFLSGDAIEHFDEGVYASNLWFGTEQGAEYPGRYYYAPPLLPFLIEWSMIFQGSGPWGTFLPSLLFGMLTVPLIWWVTRTWFGSAAGIVAASMASFSDLHLLYSRAALTDVGLGFCLLLAVYLIWKSYVSMQWKWPVLAGVTIGIGWSIKYNGWLPLAVGLSGLIPWLFLHRRQLTRLGRWPVRFLVIAAVSCLVWSPVLIGLQKWGGYSVVSANHSRYVVGFAGWMESFTRQLQNHRLLEGSLGYLGVGLMSLCFCLLLADWFRSKSETESGTSPKPGKTGSTWNIVLAGMLASLPLIVSALVGVSPVLGLLAVAGILLQLFFADGSFRLVPVPTQKVTTDELPAGVSRSLAAWLMAAWFCGLLLATPLYYPYPRLTIPWTISTWLGIAALAGWLEQRAGGSLFSVFDSSADRHPGLGRMLPACGLVGLSLVGVLLLTPWKVAAWEPRNGLAIVAQQMLADLKSDSGSSASDSILYIYAEPGLFFNLQAEGHALTGPVADFQFLEALPAGVPVYLIAGPHAATDPEFAAKFEPVRARFDLVKTYEYQPSLLVRLNQSQLNPENQRQPVHLYRAK